MVFLGLPDSSAGKESACKKWPTKNIDQLDFIKIKNFCPSKCTIKRIKRQIMGENVCILIKYLYLEYTNNSQNSLITTKPIKWAKYFNSYLTREDTWMANKRMKNTQHHQTFVKCEVKSQGCHKTPIRISEIKKIPSVLRHCCWYYKMVQPLWGILWGVLKKLNTSTTWCTHSTSRYLFKKNESMCLYKDLSRNIPKGFICNNLILRKTQMSINKRRSG